MADTSMALAVIPENGTDAYRMSTNAATVCGAIVKATAQKIQGKEYVRVEGWQAIAVAHGCSASSCNVEVVEGGIRATGQVRRMDTGQVIAEAEGFVGDDEKMWASRPMFARRAMAQTRAISRACRSAFAHVVILIDKNLGTTPAEEMQGVVDYEPNHAGNAQTRSLSVDPADKGMVQGDGSSQYQVDKEKKKREAARAKHEVDAQKWVVNAIGTVRLAGQTVDSLDTFMQDNNDYLDWLEGLFPEKHETFKAAFDGAREAAGEKVAA
jgi:hypothetical protein